MLCCCGELGSRVLQLPRHRKTSQLLRVSLCQALSAFPARRTRPPCKIQLFLDFFEANSI